MSSRGLKEASGSMKLGMFFLQIFPRVYTASSFGDTRVMLITNADLNGLGFLFKGVLFGPLSTSYAALVISSSNQPFELQVPRSILLPASGFKNLDYIVSITYLNGIHGNCLRLAHVRTRGHLCGDRCFLDHCA